MNINANINIANRRSGRFDPMLLGGLTFAFMGNYEGGDLVNELGVNIPLVSGSGLDAVYDFSVLGDQRLNLNAYVGNSHGLPENFDYPYPPEIYHDSSNPYHHKLMNFHYRFWNKQSLLVDNIVFAKLAYDSGVLQSVSEIYLFDVAQAETELDSLKGHITILADFFGEELANGWDDPAYWTLILDDNWSFSSNRANSNGSNGFMRRFGFWDLFEPYYVALNIALNSGSVIAPYDGTQGREIFSSGSYIFKYVPDGASNALTVYSRAMLGQLTDLSIKREYINYYNREIAL